MNALVDDIGTKLQTSNVLSGTPPINHDVAPKVLRDQKHDALQPFTKIGASMPANNELDNVTLLSVRIRLPRSVDSFQDLLAIAGGMHQIDVLTLLLMLPDPMYRMHKMLPEVFWPFPLFPEEIWFSDTTAQLKKLSVSSPPDFTVYCKPEWIAVYIATIGILWQGVATYEDFKEGLDSIRTDIGKQIDRLSGISDQLKKTLKRHAMRFLDSLIEMPQQHFLLVVRRLQEARRRLGVTQGLVSPELITIEQSAEIQTSSDSSD